MPRISSDYSARSSSTPPPVRFPGTQRARKMDTFEPPQAVPSGAKAKPHLAHYVAEHSAGLDAPPDAFRCPITLEYMRHPVIASDGHSYEQDAIAILSTQGGSISAS